MKTRRFRSVALCLGGVFAVILAPRLAVADTLDPDVAAVVHANNEFALDIYRQFTVAPNENVVFSPYSVSSALAMTYAGAAGQTATEMADALHFTLPQEQLHPAFGQINDQLSFGGPSQYIESTVVNRIWGQQGYNYVQNFLDATNQYYGAEMGQVDFIGAPESARQSINDWVTQQTHNKIADLLPYGSITPATRLVLANAIYFRGDWAAQFNPDDTDRYGVFRDELNNFVPASMMWQETDHGYADMPGYQAVQLKYTHEMGSYTNRASMLILLPDGNLSTLEQSLTVDALEDCVAQLESVRMDLRFPKFNIDSDYALKSILKSMGMVQAFDSGPADFSGITTDEPLFIGNVYQKATIAVTEKGTEAAAATGVVIPIGFPPPVEVSLSVDHPFLYFIRDDVTGTILFMGRVAEPLFESVPGDANGDYRVDDADAAILASHWHQYFFEDPDWNGEEDGWQFGDFNNDYLIDDMDASILASHWHYGVEEGADPTVPEPSALVAALGMTVALGLLQWRRRGRA